MVATRFAVATHLLLILAGAPPGIADDPPERSRTRGGEGTPATSLRLAGMVDTNPVVVRRITGQLARAGLITVYRGPGGAELARAPAQITLDDIWRAVHAGPARPLVPLHGAARKPGAGAAADQTVRDTLARAFAEAEAGFRAVLARQTLAALVAACATARETARETG